jgi:hypothetical protein
VKTLQYGLHGKIKITIHVPNKDYEWIHLLFSTNANPFKVLKDIGYYVKEEDKNQG